jgi:hypothetical protein
MNRKNVVQKLVSFGSNKRDYTEITKELQEGWYIASIMPHKNSFLCVLEKDMQAEAGKRPQYDTTTSLKQLLDLAKNPKRTKIMQDA